MLIRNNTESTNIWLSACSRSLHSPGHLTHFYYSLLTCCLLSHSRVVRINRELHLMSSPLPYGPACSPNSHKYSLSSLHFFAPLSLSLSLPRSHSLSRDIDPASSVLVGCALQRCWDCQRKYTVLVWNPGVPRQSVKFGHYSCNSAFMFCSQKGHVCNSHSKAFLSGLQTEMWALLVRRITLKQLPLSVKNGRMSGRLLQIWQK